jgi:hypothetical protein
MSKKLILCICLFWSTSLFSQGESIKNYLQGVWKVTNPLPNDYSYYIAVNNLHFYLFKDSKANDFFDKNDTLYYRGAYFGFPKKKWEIEAGGPDESSIINYLSNNKFYLSDLNFDTVFNNEFVYFTLEKETNDLLVMPEYEDLVIFSKNSFSLTVPSGQLNQTLVHERVLNPPAKIIQFIKDIKSRMFKTIQTAKCQIYSAPDQPTNKYLINKDEIQVLALKGDWIEFRYFGTKKVTHGWIRKKDTE